MWKKLLLFLVAIVCTNAAAQESTNWFNVEKIKNFALDGFYLDADGDTSSAMLSWRPNFFQFYFLEISPNIGVAPVKLNSEDVVALYDYSAYIRYALTDSLKLGIIAGMQYYANTSEKEGGSIGANLNYQNPMKENSWLSWIDSLNLSVLHISQSKDFYMYSIGLEKTL